MNDESKLPHCFALTGAAWVLHFATKCFEWAHNNASDISLLLAVLASLATIWHAVPAGLVKWREWRRPITTTDNDDR